MADLCERQRTKLPAPRPPAMGGLLPVIPLPNICLVLRTLCLNMRHANRLARKPLFFRQGLNRRRHAFFAAAGPG